MTENPLSIPAPRADRPPLKVNVYRFAQTLNSQLSPLFPYLDPGAIVPTAAVLRGERDKDMGYFLHFNTVDEVFMCFGSSGGRYRPGQVAVGARTHGVGGPQGDESSFNLMTITQRQAEDGEQSESIGFACAECQEPLFVHQFDVELTGPPERLLDTVGGALVASDAFNADAELRTCRKCGCVNPPFPDQHWGWRSYASNTWVAQNARAALAAAAEGGR